MTSEEIVSKAKAALPEGILLKAGVVLGDAVLHVDAGKLRAAAEFLKNDPELRFDYLSHITGVDYLADARELRFEVVYEWHSLDLNHSVRVRVGVPEENPVVPSVHGLWPSAVYPERELFDMFGIKVEGHPNLKRLLMPEDWEGHPLRRDYSLTTETVAFTHNIDYKKELVQRKEPFHYRPNET